MSRKLQVGDVHKCGQTLTAEMIYRRKDGTQECKVCGRAAMSAYGKRRRRELAADRQMGMDPPARRRRHHDRDYNTDPMPMGEHNFESTPLAATIKPLAISTDGVFWKSQVVRRDRLGRVTVLVTSRETFPTVEQAYAYATRLMAKRSA